MARNVTGRPGQKAVSGPMSGQNDDLSVEQFMLIAVANSALDVIASGEYNQLHSAVSAQGGSLPFTEEEYYKYQLTAVKTRAKFVLNRRWREFGYQNFELDVHDEWALSTFMLSVLAAIGVSRIGGSGLQIIPLWDSGADELTLDRIQRDSLTQRIKSVYQQTGMRFERTISDDRDGHQSVLVLTYLPEKEKWLTAEPAGLEDVATSYALGLTNVNDVVPARGGPQYAIVDTDALAEQLLSVPLWAPPLQFKKQTVVKYLPQLSDLTK